jgi:hypothetical protein
VSLGLLPQRALVIDIVEPLTAFHYWAGVMVQPLDEPYLVLPPNLLPAVVAETSAGRTGGRRERCTCRRR